MEKEELKECSITEEYDKENNIMAEREDDRGEIKIANR